jgi:hypothetical protein
MAMPTMAELQDRSRALFTELLIDHFPDAGATGAAPSRQALASTRTGGPRPFSWFNPDDARAATIFAAELAISAAAAEDVTDGLAAALDLADARRFEESPALVRSGLSMFVTHSRSGRQLVKPRTVAARPQAFLRSTTGTSGAEPAGGPVAGLTLQAPAEAALDYWREDALANEHHEHWHEVYPYAGLFPTDWAEWAASTDRGNLAALFEQLDPQPALPWPEFLRQNTPAVIRDRFLNLARALPDFGAFVRALPAPAYRALFRLNDRQGELFVYMHRQMLARYDAERRALGLPEVTAFAPPYTAAPPDGYDPAPLPYLPRPAGVPLAPASAASLVRMFDEIDAGARSGAVLGSSAADVPLDRTIIGEVIEAAEARLRTPLRAGKYPGLHNIGHGRISGISVPPPGSTEQAVMNDPAVAIRDPIFWRWHKGIDDLAAVWQDAQPPYDLADVPPVIVRDALDGDPAAAWASPDIYLVSRSSFDDDDAAAAAIEAALGGAALDQRVADGPVPGLAGYRLGGELVTRFGSSTLGTGTVEFLTHDPFGYAVRIRNTAASPTAVTVRVFIAPEESVETRSAWIELDKVLYEVPAGSTGVLYRPDTEFSVIKRPAEVDPSAVIEGGTDPDDQHYCVCGWPWTLVIPRGTPNGSAYRLIVVCTDATIDQVPTAEHCGSMSYCGAVDGYPDTRDMGYPFSRPIPGGVAALLGQPNIGGRTLTIKHQ